MHALLADADLGLRVAADAVAARCGLKGELHDGGTIAPVRELVIVLTDLYHAGSERAADTAGHTRLPGIEHAGRFGARTALAGGWRDWLAGAVGRDDLAGVAPARIAAAVLPAQQGGTSWIATPVHLSAGLSQVHLDHRGLLRLGEAQRAALAASFATEFGASGLTLAPLESGEFLLHGAGLEAVPTTEPARCAGGEVAAALPHGPEAAAVRRLGAEIELWLHRHPLNAARAGLGEPPVNALWLWGAAGREGSLRRGEGAPQRRAFGADACLRGLWHLQGGACQALPGEFGALAQGGAGAVLALAVADELRMSMASTFLQALRALDERFIAPALTQLRRGHLERVTLIANDHALQLHRRSALKVWRRARAGLESFA
jgi:hypothetical protein